MSKKIIEWESIAAKRLGRVDGVTEYICQIDPESKEYIGFEFDSDLELNPITKPDDINITMARVEKHHAQKWENKTRNVKIVRG